MVDQEIRKEAERRGLRVEWAHIRKDKRVSWDAVLRGALQIAIKLGQIKPYLVSDGHFLILSAPNMNAITRCRVFREGESEPCGMGYSFCSVNFCKATGRRISLERAMP